METKVITAHIPIPLALKVDQLAERLERSRGWVVKQALSAWVAQEEDRRQLTLQALADVDAGHLVEHESAKAWAAGLDSGPPEPPPKK